MVKTKVIKIKRIKANLAHKLSVTPAILIGTQQVSLAEASVTPMLIVLSQTPQ